MWGIFLKYVAVALACLFVCCAFIVAWGRKRISLWSLLRVTSGDLIRGDISKDLIGQGVAVIEDEEFWFVDVHVNSQGILIKKYFFPMTLFCRPIFVSWKKVKRVLLQDNSMTSKTGKESHIDAIIDIDGFPGLPILVPWRREFNDVIPSNVGVDDRCSRRLLV